MEQQDNLRELEDLRSQIAILKQKLDDQEIVNQQRLKKMMRNGLSKIQSMGILGIAGGIFAIVLSTAVFYKMNLSWTFIVITIFFLAACVVLTMHWHFPLYRLDVSGESMLSVAEKVSRLRKTYAEWPKKAMWLVSAWLLLLIWETYSTMGEVALPFVCGACVGGIIGGIIGLKMNRKVVNAADEVLEQIRKMKQ